MHLAWSPDKYEFVSVGKDHMVHCTFDQNKVVKKSGKSASTVSHSSVVWSKIKEAAIFTAGADGKLYHWENAAVVKMHEICKGAVQSICSYMEGKQEVLLVGANNKAVFQFSFDGKAIQKLKEVQLEAVARSIDYYEGNVLCGLKNGDIIVSSLKDWKPEVIMQSHSEGECWGLEVIHLDNGEIRVLTAADDNRILSYDLKKRGNLAEGFVKVENGKKKSKTKVMGGASSMST